MSKSHYDQNLLGATPVTPQQLQEGYNVDLLDSGRGRKSVTTTPPALTDVEAPKAVSKRRTKNESPSAEKTPIKKTPFLRTTRGKIILLIAGILIVGGIVGGAVGGTVGKGKTLNSAMTSGNSPLQSASDTTTDTSITPAITQDSSIAPATTQNISTGSPGGEGGATLGRSSTPGSAPTGMSNPSIKGQ